MKRLMALALGSEPRRLRRRQAHQQYPYHPRQVRNHLNPCNP